MSDDQQTPEVDQKRGDSNRKRKRPKGWLDKAIKDGSVRDPKLGVEPHRKYPDGVNVVELVTVDASARGREG